MRAASRNRVGSATHEFSIAMSCCPRSGLNWSAAANADNGGRMDIATFECHGGDQVELLAAILARGVLRLRQRDVREARIGGNSGDHGLALCSSSCPSVVDGSESRRKE